MSNVYGHNDVTENETISLRITFNERVSAYCSDVVLFGKTLAYAYRRDSSTMVGDDVFISGSASSDGNRNSWASIIDEGSVAVLSNVNKSVYDKTEPKYNIIVEVLESKVNKLQLCEEKERLLKKIAKIDKLLQE